MKHIVRFISVLFPIFVIADLNFYNLNVNIFRPLMILIPAIIIFSFYKSKYRWLDFIFLILSIATFGYAVFELGDLVNRGSIDATNLDIIFGTLAILLVLEMTRRTIGNALPILAIIFIIYSLFGEYMIGDLAHSGYSYKMIVTTLFTTRGIFGSALAVVSTFVAMFIIFAASLEVTGVGDVFFDFSKSIAGTSRGGPAKIATITSGLFGSISGSAVANVAATGSFTIPMMKRMGYKSIFAGAVEAAASTGGQLMPPIMAAGAFLMAEMLGVSYIAVITAALIPAILYYLTVWVTIDFRSIKIGLEGLPKKEVPSLKKILLKQGYMLVPIIVIIVELAVFKVSPIRAAFIAMIFSVLLGLIKKDTRPNIKTSINALANATDQIATIIAPIASAGIIIGIIGLTGLGDKIARFVINVSGGHMLLTLFFAMIVAIIFGMGLPTTVSYLLVIAVLAPTLFEVGVEPIAAHMFVFYYACLSGITPPVGLAAYTGANLAHSPPIRTSIQSCLIAASAFILPYLFIFNPEVLMEGTWYNILLTFLFVSLGLISFVSGVEGWLLIKSTILDRISLLISALLFILPFYIANILGLIILTVILYMQKKTRKS